MNASLFQFSANKWLGHPLNKLTNYNKVKLVLCFAGKELMQQENIYSLLADKFIGADVVMCSTAGEIYQDTVLDDSLSVVALEFDKTKLITVSVNIKDFNDSYAAASGLIGKLSKENLKYIMVFSDGSLVNGSELAKGLNDAAGKGVLITGGLAGDAANFKSTLIGLNEQPIEGNIVAIGFYGDQIVVTHGSKGGWDMFGLEKVITKSEANVLYEIDGENALDFYKKYLGPDAQNLPASALLFPLAVTEPGAQRHVVRTILSINEEDKSMTFAGDVPMGGKIRLMRANFDKITDAASDAAANSISTSNLNPDFSLLISCVGRKLILGPRIEEEVEIVSETFKNETVMAGFYSYGEISPFNEGGICQLHNQTMTITSFYELS
ncbi:MAG: FIST C-terminal domain-containing protein [Oligoflexus sp.]|nr:FIST C-terminal domain-containing protein [Pseudopedobacter sp.]